MKLGSMIILCVLFMASCNNTVGNNNAHKQWAFHTTPDKWEEPRIFQTPFDNNWADRISFSRQSLEEIKGEKIYSPNKAYWYIADQPDTMKPGPYNFTIDIYNERDYIIRLNMIDIYGNFERQARWINEKLIYSKVWLGRVLGIELIFDVETEKIIYKEHVNYGTIPFLQWQRAKQKE